MRIGGSRGEDPAAATLRQRALRDTRKPIFGVAGRAALPQDCLGMIVVVGFDFLGRKRDGKRTAQGDQSQSDQQDLSK